MLFLRKLLFWVFVVVYIIICPLLILYALGYIYSPVKQELVHTGVLYIATVPAGADVYLAKSHFSHTTPATIRELLPGSYKVTLRKKGYRAWTHSITIEAGKAVTFKNILLIPNNWPQKNITADTCKDLIPIENDQSFLITTGSELGSFFIYNVNGAIRSLSSIQSPFSTLPVTKVYSAAESDVLIIYGGSFGDKKYLYLNLKDNKPYAIDITRFFPDEPSFIAWQAAKETDLFTCRKNCINFINVETGKTFPCYLENIKGFGIYGEGLYIIDQNNVLTYQTFETYKQKDLSEDMHLAKRLFDRSEFYRIEARNADTIFFLGTKGDFIVSSPPYHIAAQDVIGYKFGGNPDLLLYWTKTSLAIADFSISRDKTTFHENFKVQTIYENGRSIKQAFWLDDRSHILCNDADSIYLIELQPQGPPHVESILGIKGRTKVFYDGDENTLYYLDADSGVLNQIQIIPKQPITISPFRMYD